jgi:acyl carrier protein
MKVSRDDVVGVIASANVVENAAALRPSVPLVEQGVDSLGIFNILLLLDQKYGIETPDEDIGELRTIDSIVDYLNRRLV